MKSSNQGGEAKVSVEAVVNDVRLLIFGLYRAADRLHEVISSERSEGGDGD